MNSPKSGSIRVLHVDDEPDVAELAAEFIERQNDEICVETTTSANAALDRLSVNDFDCIVSDFDMPGQDGIEFLQAVRDDWPNLPFILYTGKGSEEVASEAISAGVTDYLHKETGSSQYEILTNRIVNAVKQRRSQQEVAETERRLQTLAENTNDVLWKFNADWSELLFINSAYEDIWGRSTEELRERPKSFLEGIHPDDQPAVKAAMEQLSGGEFIDLEFRVNADEDFGRWVWVQGEPVSDDSGGVEKVVGFVRDVTERKMREQELRESTRRNERFKTLIDHMSDIIFVVDETGEISYINSAVEEILGYEPADLVGQNGFDIIHPEDTERAQSELDKTIEDSEYIGDLEFRAVHADGSTVDLELRATHQLENPNIGGVVVVARDISRRRRQERRYEAVFNSSYTFIGLLEPDGTVLEINETALSFGDVEREEVLGKPLWATSWFQSSEDTRAVAQEGVDQARNGELFRDEIRVEGSNREAVVDFTVRPVFDDQGEVIHLVSEGRDITERKEREDELRHLKEEYETVFSTAQDAIFLFDVEQSDSEYEFRLRQLNPAHETISGLSIEDDRGKTPIELLGEEDGSQVREKYRECAETQESLSYEEILNMPTGSLYWRTNIAPVIKEDEVQQIVGIARDITDQKDRERELKQERDRVKALFENTVDPVAYSEFIEGEPIVQDINPAFEEAFGCDRESAVGRPIDEIVVPEDTEKQQEAKELNRRIEAGERIVTEVRRQTPDGVRDFLLQSTPLEPGESGTETYAIYSDITERKEREESLERYETLVEVTGDPMYMLDEEGRFTYVNEALVETSGHRKESLIGEPVRRVMDTEDVEQGEELIRSLLAAGERQGTFEMELVTTDGDRIPTENHISLLYADGEFKGSVGVLRDITDRLERERQLQRERDRLDEFAGVLSHDLRNPLNVAAGRLKLAMGECESEHLEPVDRAHHRMEQLINDMLSLARAGGAIGETEAVELAELADACWQNVDTESATLQAETEATIQADKSRLQQLLENLLRNAVEHGGDGVMITIGDLPDGFYVEDDGPGIPEDVRAKVLEPGYSTSEKGTGFGLSIVRDIAESHGWEIDLTEGAKGGARFEFTMVAMD